MKLIFFVFSLLIATMNSHSMDKIKTDDLREVDLATKTIDPEIVSAFKSQNINTITKSLSRIKVIKQEIYIKKFNADFKAAIKKASRENLQILSQSFSVIKERDKLIMESFDAEIKDNESEVDFSAEQITNQDARHTELTRENKEIKTNLFKGPAAQFVIGLSAFSSCAVYAYRHVTAVQVKEKQEKKKQNKLKKKTQKGKEAKCCDN